MKENAVILGNGSIGVPANLSALPRRDFEPIEAGSCWQWASVVEVAHPGSIYAPANARAYAPVWSGNLAARGEDWSSCRW